MKELIYLQNVVTLQLDQEKCTGCGMCLIVCPHAVLGMDNGHARIETITTVLLALVLISLVIVDSALEAFSEPREDVTPGWFALSVVLVSGPGP